MRFIHVLLIGFMLSGFGVSAQKGKPLMEFSSKVHDFGKLKEEKGKQVYSFEFVNKGTSPIIIKNVRSSCGCTSLIGVKHLLLLVKKVSLRQLLILKTVQVHLTNRLL